MPASRSEPPSDGCVSSAAAAWQDWLAPRAATPASPDCRAAAPNALWQADHTLLDILILDEAGKPARPWLTTVIDDHSRAIAGCMLFLGAPSVLNTCLALRHAIWRKADPAWPICGDPHRAVLPALRPSHHAWLPILNVAE